jgi:hypothetical protein
MRLENYSEEIKKTKQLQRRRKLKQNVRKQWGAELPPKSKLSATNKEEQNQELGDGWYYYELIRKCYIHGVMDGEAMRVQNEKSIPKTVFEIR